MVKHQQCSWGDYYEGSKDELITEGVAKPCWFPSSPQLDERGRTRRTFDIEDAGVHVRLMQRGARDSWYVGVDKRRDTPRESTPRSVPIASTNHPNPDGRAAAAKLEPIMGRLAGCSGLLSAAIDDVDGKIRRAKTAYEQYADFKPEWADPSEWPEIRERHRAWATSLADSSKLRRAIEELQTVRSNLRAVIGELERLVNRD